MNNRKKNDSGKQSLVVHVTTETHKRLSVLQWRWQSRHGERIRKAVIAGLALDASIDKYDIE